MIKAPHSSRSGERPRSVTLVAWGVLLIGLVNGWRTVAILQQRSVLLEWQATIDPAWMVLVSLIWTMLFIVASFTIIRQMPVARWFTPIVLLLFALSEWLTSALIKGNLKSIIAESGDPLPATTMMFIVISFIVALILNKKSAREYFDKTT